METTHTHISRMSSPTFEKRLVDLPLVSGAFSVYNYVKNMNDSISYFVGGMESGVIRSFKAFPAVADPVLNVVGLSVEKLASRGLDTVEYYAPIIKKCPIEILEDGKKYTILIISGATDDAHLPKTVSGAIVARVSSISSAISGNKYGRYIINTIERYVHSLEKFIDHILQREDEESDDCSQEIDLYHKIRCIISKNLARFKRFVERMAGEDTTPKRTWENLIIYINHAIQELYKKTIITPDDTRYEKSLKYFILVTTGTFLITSAAMVATALKLKSASLAVYKMAVVLYSKLLIVLHEAREKEKIFVRNIMILLKSFLENFKNEWEKSYILYSTNAAVLPATMNESTQGLKGDYNHYDSCEEGSCSTTLRTVRKLSDQCEEVLGKVTPESSKKLNLCSAEEPEDSPMPDEDSSASKEKSDKWGLW